MNYELIKEIKANGDIFLFYRDENNRCIADTLQVLQPDYSDEDLKMKIDIATKRLQYSLKPPTLEILKTIEL